MSMIEQKQRGRRRRDHSILENEKKVELPVSVVADGKANVDDKKHRRGNARGGGFRSIRIQWNKLRSQIQGCCSSVSRLLDPRKNFPGTPRRRRLRDDKNSSDDCLPQTQTLLRQSSLSIPLLLSTILFIYVLYNLITNFYAASGHNLRPRTDAELDNMELQIPCFDFDRQERRRRHHHAVVDVGGWSMFHFFFEPTGELNNRTRPHYGGIDYESTNGVKRNIAASDHRDFILYRTKLLNETRRRHHKDEEDEEREDDPDMLDDSDCRPPSWSYLYNPSCNGLHEIQVDRDFDQDIEERLGNDQVYDSFYISHGYYRDVWVVAKPDAHERSVLKTVRWKHDYDSESFLMTLRDALVMERLTHSERIVDIFGHCGTAVMAEAIPFEVEEYVVPGRGRGIDQEELHDEEYLNPRNSFTAEEKLDMALTMAESIADLHGFEDGVIVHDDIQLCQWLRTEDDKIKLGDFNRAEIMMYNVEKGKYCKYVNGECYGNYRAPEEFAARELNEKIDVWSFGNNIYALLTGLWVFYDMSDDEAIQKNVIDGKLAFVDKRYSDRSFIEGKLVDIMKKCWEYEPSKRIDIFEVVRFLRNVKEEHHSQHLGLHH